ncbi:MAG TPA: hypothetical protein VI136_02805 [Verrucomicrobiae bacterium]
MKTNYDSRRSRYRVSYKVNGKQHRRFFAKKTYAETFCADRRQDVRQFGVPWATLTPLQRAEIQVQVDRLKRAGWTLRAAVGFTHEHGKAPPALPCNRSPCNACGRKRRRVAVRAPCGSSEPPLTVS